MPKNIVLCCDGTSNEYGTKNTNVVHLFKTLVQDPETQLAYYHPSLGSIGVQGAWSRTAGWFKSLLGQAFGRGLSDEIRSAYLFLMQHYEAGDRTFFFGFSRGAYTVRALAGMLHLFGLIRKGNEPLVPYAIRMLTKRDDHTFEVARDVKATFSRECKPYFVGVWDTVSSVGWFRNSLKIPYSANNPAIKIARHALAIDERRALFRPSLWRPLETPLPHGPEDLKQVWFPGVHCDVGGGYAEAESGLSKVALAWMLREAIEKGLEVNEAMVKEVLGASGSGKYTAPEPRARIHNSLTPAWWVAEFVPQKYFDWKTKATSYRMNLGRRRTIPDDSLIHTSAFERGPGYSPNLPAIYSRAE